MAVYEQDLDRIVIRVVYDGPGRAGKTTNIEQLARLFGGETPDLQLLAADNGHTTFFDWFTFDGGMIDGHRLLIQILGVPGAKRFEHRRAHILRSADAVVLVCDSAPGTADLARETLDSLREHLGKRAASVPVIVQANKQDLPGALQAHEVGAALGLPYEVPVIGAEATAGIGTRETAVHAIRSAVRLVKRRTAKPGLQSILGTAGTLAALRTALEATQIGDAGPDDDEPIDLQAAAEPAVPGRKVFRPTMVDEPNLVYMHNQSSAVQAARIRLGEPGDADRNYDPNETLPSHPVLEDSPEPPSRGRKGRRRDTETSEARSQRTRKDRPTQTSESRQPARAAQPAPAARKIPPRRRPPSGPITAEIPTPPSGVRIIKDRPPSADAPLPRERPPSDAVRIVDDIPVPRERPPSGAAPLPRDRPPSNAVPVARDRPPSDAVRIIEDRPPSGPVPVPRDRPPSGSVRVVSERPPSGAVQLAGDRPPSSPAPRFHPPSSPTAAPPTPAPTFTRPPDGPLPVRTSTSPDPQSLFDVSSTADTLPPIALDTRTTARPPATLTPHDTPALGLPRPPIRLEDDLSPRPGSLSPGPDAPPSPDLPPGHVWPVPGGRAVLKALAAAAPPRFTLPSPADHTRYSAGTFHLTAHPFPDEAQALAALLARARAWQPVAPLLPRGLALAAEAEPDGRANLWRVATQLPRLAEHLADLATTARLRLLEAHAHTLGQAFALCRRRRIVLDLHPDAYAVEYGRIVHIGEHFDHGDRFTAAGPALLALPERLADDPTIDAFIDALARELTALVDGEATDLGLADALLAAAPIAPTAIDARARLLSALGQPT